MSPTRKLLAGAAIALLCFTTEISYAHQETEPLRNILIFPRTGDGFSAQLVRVDPDTLVVFTTDFRYIAKKDIGKIILHREDSRSSGFASGSIIGLYAVNYLLGTANGQPAPFLSSNSFGGGYSDNSYSVNGYSMVGIAVVSILVGGGVGWLADHSSDANETFLFDPNSPHPSDDWVEFESATDRTTHRPKFRFSVQGGDIISRIARPYQKDAQAAGLRVRDSYSYYASTLSVTAQDASDFNWLRSISANFAISDRIEIGAMTSWLAEPTFGAEVQVSVPDQRSSSVRDTKAFRERISGNGYYVIGTYNLPVSSSGEVVWSSSLGAGLASMHAEVSASFARDSASVRLIDQLYRYDMKKMYPSGVISSYLSYDITHSLSLGVGGAYYLVLGSQVVPEIPWIGIASKTLGFGTFDLGFTMGLHF